MSSERFVQSHIKQLPLFQRLPDDQLQLIANITEVLRFEPGMIVFQEGSPAQGLFMFIAGRGILSRLEPNTAPTGPRMIDEPVGEVNANEYVGETSLFVQTTENTTLRVVESAVILFLSHQRLVALLASHPELRTNLGAQRGDQHKLIKSLFKGQRTDEVVLQIFRRHWWAFGRFFWVPLVLATLFVVGAVLLTGSPVLALGLAGMALIIPGGVMFLLYLDWTNDTIVVTDQRVVRVETKLMRFESTLSEIPLDRVIEVSVGIPPGDAAAQFFNYATVTVKAAEPSPGLVLTMLSNSNEVRKVIFENRDRVKQMMEEQSKRVVQSEVDRVLGLNETSFAPVASVNPAGILNPSKPSAFSFSPVRMKFTNENGETVYRKHWSIWLARVTPPIILIMVCMGIIIATIFLPQNALGPLGIIVPVFIILLALVWLYSADWDWRNDEFILGDEVITLIQKRPLLLHNEIDQVRLDQVDSVVSDVRGIINNLLQRGDVRISLVGSDDKVLVALHNPQEIQAEISQRQARRRMQIQQGDAERQRESIAEYLAAYHDRVAPRDIATAQPLPQTQPQRTTTQTVPIARDVPTQAIEPPPQAIRDAVRPPRVPRMRPNDLPP